MQSKAETVDAYLTEVPAERLAAMQRIRALCLEHLPGWSERMQWGMPGYGPPAEDAAVSFNSQKNCISFYPGATAIEPHRDTLKKASFGRGCVRFAKPDAIDFAAIAEMLRTVRASRP